MHTAVRISAHLATRISVTLGIIALRSQSLVNAPRGKIGLSYGLCLWDFIFSCRLCFFPYSCISSYLLLFVCLISFLLFPMRKCLGKHSCTSSFPIVILNDTSFFPTVQLQVHNENPARCGRNTDALVNLNTKLTQLVTKKRSNPRCDTTHARAFLHRLNKNWNTLNKLCNIFKLCFQNPELVILS